MAEKRMTAAQAIVEYLIGSGVQYVFGIFGHGNVQLGEALAERSDEIMFIQAKNEQAAVHMAIGYYRQSGNIAAVTTSIGPGATNMATGALVARIGRFPVLLLPGEAFVHRYPRGPVLQEIEDMETANDCLRPVSIFYRTLVNSANVKEVMDAAFRSMNVLGREGPAVIPLPMDVQAESFVYDTGMLVADSKKISRGPEDELARRAANVLLSASRPIIIAGGGVLRSPGAAEELAALSSKLQIPVVHTQGGMGALLWDHPYNLFSCGPTGTPLGNDYAQAADVVFAIGTRLDDFTTSSETLFSDSAKFITLNVNCFDAEKPNPSIRIIGDAGKSLAAIMENVGDRMRLSYDDAASFDSNIAADKKAWLLEADRLLTLMPNDEGLLPQSRVIGILNDVLPDDAVIVAAAGSLPGDLLSLWRCNDATRKGYHLEYDASTMGYEIPGAIGVKIAEPKRHVMSLLGDGSFLMNPTEILTAVQERLAITFVVIDSQGHRSIQGCQEGNSLQKFGTEYRMRNEHSARLDGENLPLDLVAIAEGLGAHAYQAESEEQIRSVLETAMSTTDVPTVIVIPVDSTRTVPNYSFWDVPIPEVSDRQELQDALDEYRKNIARRVAR